MMSGCQRQRDAGYPGRGSPAQPDWLVLTIGTVQVRPGTGGTCASFNLPSVTEPEGDCTDGCAEELALNWLPAGIASRRGGRRTQ
jgi:hypothetical protein